jgi:hypothetical protein
MALTTPRIISPIIPFSASQSYTFKFSVISGDQVYSNELEIQKNSDYTQVYLLKIDSFKFEHTINAGVLTNGVEYRCRIRTYNANGQYSNWSDWVVFKCLSTPIVQITNIIDGKINNQTYTFTGSYSQAEGELLQSYKFLLYNGQGVLLSVSPELFDGLLQYEFTGLQNGVTYKIELKVITVNQVEATTGLVSFIPNYIQPRLATVITLKNIKDQASVEVSANIIQIIGYGSNFTYENNEWANVKNGMVYFQDGFNINKDFTLKIWLKNITENEIFLRLLGKYGEIRLIYYQNKIRAYKIVNNFTSYFVSNEITISAVDNVVFIFMQQINDLINLQAEILS